MSIQKPNCENCSHPKNMRSRYGMNCEFLGENIEPDTVKITGCLSHPNAREYLNAGVIQELRTINISNSVHCVKEGKCGFKSQLAAKNGFPCQFVGCVERLPSLPTSKERENIIRNQMLDRVWVKCNEIASGSSDDMEYTGGELKVPLCGASNSLHSIIESLRSEQP